LVPFHFHHSYKDTRTNELKPANELNRSLLLELIPVPIPLSDAATPRHFESKGPPRLGVLLAFKLKFSEDDPQVEPLCGVLMI
jgi:hypothetical protein